MGVDQRRAEDYPGLTLPGGFNVLDGYGGQVLSASAKPGLVVGRVLNPPLWSPVYLPRRFHIPEKDRLQRC
jgi:hypothetical protein